MKPVAVFGCYLLSGLKITQLDSTHRPCLQTVRDAVRSHPRRSRNAAQQKATQTVITGQVLLKAWMCRYLLLPDMPRSTSCKLCVSSHLSLLCAGCLLKGHYSQIKKNYFSHTVALAVGYTTMQIADSFSQVLRCLSLAL